MLLKHCLKFKVIRAKFKFKLLRLIRTFNTYVVSFQRSIADFYKKKNNSFDLIFLETVKKLISDNFFVSFLFVLSSVQPQRRTTDHSCLNKDKTSTDYCQLLCLALDCLTPTECFCKMHIESSKATVNVIPATAQGTWVVQTKVKVRQMSNYRSKVTHIAT